MSRDRRRPSITITLGSAVYAEAIAYAERENDGNLSRLVERALAEFLHARGVSIGSAPRELELVSAVRRR